MLGLLVSLVNKKTAGQSDDLFGRAMTNIKQRAHNDS